MLLKNTVERAPAWLVLLPVGIGTCLSLLGDASLYVVLPTHTSDAGVALASVGILLSANRFIRLLLNGPAGVVYDRSPRRWLFVSALFLGTFSTALYGFTQGFFPLLVGRLLWGVAWVGIWIGGNTIVLDISRADTRGRWVGLYQVSFFLGASGGALLGGFLTDRLGYHQAMIICAGLTLLGAGVALLFLPETRGFKADPDSSVSTDSRFQSGAATPKGTSVVPNSIQKMKFTTSLGLYSAHRLAMAGVFQATFGLFLLGLLGAQVEVAGHSVGVATLTGLGLGLSTLISASSAPIIGSIADNVGNRWRVAAGGLLPGIAGFGLLAAQVPLSVLAGVPLVSITGGSNQGMSTAFIGDLSDTGKQSRRLGVMFTAGDLASAVGPPFALALVPAVGIRNVYVLIAGLFAVLFLGILAMDRRQSAVQRRPPA